MFENIMYNENIVLIIQLLFILLLNIILILIYVGMC